VTISAFRFVGSIKPARGQSSPAEEGSGVNREPPPGTEPLASAIATALQWRPLTPARSGWDGPMATGFGQEAASGLSARIRAFTSPPEHNFSKCFTG
jgi:hypothetical protein